MDLTDQKKANDQTKMILSALRIIALMSDPPPSWWRIYIEFRGYDCNTITSKLRVVTFDRTELQLHGINLERVPLEVERHFYNIWTKRLRACSVATATPHGI